MQNLIAHLGSTRRRIFLPLLLKNDFAEARRQIPALKGYNDYQDHTDEMEGYLVGMTSAGLDARLVPFALFSFNSWASHALRRPTAKSLSEFARIVAIARRSPVISFEFRRDDGKAVIRLQADLGESSTAIRFDSYRRLQSSPTLLGLGGMPLAPEVYCQLLLERWSELA